MDSVADGGRSSWNCRGVDRSLGLEGMDGAKKDEASLERLGNEAMIP